MLKKNTFISQCNSGNEICRISKGTKISGILSSLSDIRIDGMFEGTIHTKGKLVIGETSIIKGKVFCHNCDMWGKVDGNIFIEDVINLKNNSSLTGSLKSPKIGIEIGAIFNGSCNIITKEEYNKYLQKESNDFLFLDSEKKTLQHSKAEQTEGKMANQPLL